MTSPEVLQPSIHNTLAEYIDDFSSETDVTMRRKIDWLARVSAADSTELDNELQYLIVTHGIEQGLSPKAVDLIKAHRARAGELFLIPIGQRSNELGYLGKLPDPTLRTGWNLYAFDDIPEDQPALWSSISLNAKALAFGNGCTSYSGETGPFYNLSQTPAVRDFRYGISARHAIVPQPVPYEIDPEGISFTEPLNYYDEESLLHDTGQYWRGTYVPRMIIGASAVKAWFDEFTKGNYFEDYTAQLAKVETPTS